MNLTLSDVATDMNVSDFENDPDFYITRVGPDSPSIQTLIPQRQENYTISLLLSGSVTKLIDFQKYDISAPAVLSLAPEQINQYLMVDDCEMICISFRRDFLMTEMQGWIACWECMLGYVVMEISSGQMDDLLLYSKLMVKEWEADRSRKKLVIRNILQAFIIHVARLRNAHQPVMQMDTVQNRLVHQFKTLVDTHFRQKTRVAEYASLLAVTPGHLNDVIKANVGKTAKQVIDERRITEARRLLMYGDHSAKEIAGLLHMQDNAYFTRFFKKLTGQSPIEFQKTIREKYH